MKTTLPVIVAALLPLAASAQQTFLQCDFSEGIPADFTLYDLEGVAELPLMKASEN